MLDLNAAVFALVERRKLGRLCLNRCNLILIFFHVYSSEGCPVFTCMSQICFRYCYLWPKEWADPVSLGFPFCALGTGTATVKNESANVSVGCLRWKFLCSVTFHFFTFFCNRCPHPICVKLRCLM